MIRQPELQDHDKWLSGEMGLPPRLEVREGVSPPTQGGRQRLWLPDLAWKLKSLKQFIETPEWTAGAQSVGRIQDDGINVSNVLRVISFELPCAYFKHLNDHPRFSKTVSRSLMSLPLPARPPQGRASVRLCWYWARWSRAVLRLQPGLVSGGSHAKPLDKGGLGLSPGSWHSWLALDVSSSSQCHLCQFSKTICSAFKFFIVRENAIPFWVAVPRPSPHVPPPPSYFMNPQTAGKLENWPSKEEMHLVF